MSCASKKVSTRKQSLLYVRTTKCFPFICYARFEIERKSSSTNSVEKIQKEFIESNVRLFYALSEITRTIYGC